MLSLYNKTNFECSKLITQNYSTSFSMGIRLFSKELRNPIYAIYGFVRFADEIVDTFHDYDKVALIKEFRTETFKAIYNGISLNPVLHSFQLIVNEFNIDHSLIVAFLDSMEMDLEKKTYADSSQYNQYIYGSAEVVGLMCLQVFCKNDKELYQSLVPSARSLGAAFQKVNFLRDMNSDYTEKGRVYFPGIDFENFDNLAKEKIISEIKLDFEFALSGIKQLPIGAKKGVHLAYIYYLNLFKKIEKSTIQEILNERIRVNNGKKMYLMANVIVRNYLNSL
jgi:phytoene/squalene synthetase